ncbi:MAG: heme exporter protein CcmD [Allosphingosinicella sp.]
MNHWPFIIAAYAIGIAATLGLGLWSWAAMRRAEAQATRLAARDPAP